MGIRKQTNSHNPSVIFHFVCSFTHNHPNAMSIGTQRHIKDCETLYDLCLMEHAAGRRKLDQKGIMKQAYDILGSFLIMDDDDLVKDEGSVQAIDIGRSYFWIGFSLAEKRCWEAATGHWENAQVIL
jgi:hypothetical protein